MRFLLVLLLLSPGVAHAVVVSRGGKVVDAKKEPAKPKIKPKGKPKQAKTPVVVVPPSAPEQVSALPTLAPSSAETQATPVATTAVTAPIPPPVVSAPKPSPARGDGVLKIAVYDLEAQGVAPEVGVIVTENLLAEARKLSGVSAIGMNEIRDMLTFEATKQLSGCSETADACLAELAGALGVDELLTGKLTQVGGSSEMLVRRIDQKRAAVKGTFNARLKAGTGTEFLASIGPAISQLYPLIPLRAGVVRGVDKEVAVRLDPPPIPKWVDLTLGAAAVASGIAGGAFGLLAIDSQNQFQHAANASIPVGATQANGTQLRAVQATGLERARVADGLFIAAGTLALATIVVALFTDWKGYREALHAHVSVK